MLKKLAVASVAVCLLTGAAWAQSLAQEWDCGEGEHGVSSAVKCAFDDATGVLAVSGTGPMLHYPTLCEITITNNDEYWRYSENGCKATTPWSSDMIRAAITSVVIEDGVTSIGSYAFADLPNLASVAIGRDVTAIWNSAFRGSCNLTHPTIPDNVTEIGKEIFDGCPERLINITWDKKGTLTIGGAKAISDDLIGSIDYLNSTGIRNAITTIIIGDSVPSIGGGAFASLPNLKSVTIGQSVENIGGNAFGGCNSIVSVIILNPSPPNFVGLPVMPTPRMLFADAPESACLYVPDPSVSAYKAFGGGYVNPEAGYDGFSCIKPLSDYNTSISLSPKNVSATRSAAVRVTVRGRTLSVMSPVSSELTVRIIDMRGKVMARYNVGANGNSPENLSLTKIPAGRYFMDVKGAGVKQTLPVVVK